MGGSTECANKTVVLGDLITDYWRYYTSTRTSPDTGEPVINDEHTGIYSAGGAGNVVKHLKNLGINTESYCDWDLVPTKVRYVVNNRVVMRIDMGDFTVPPNLSTFIWDNVQAVIVSDYAKGAVTPDVIRWLWLHRDKYKYLFVDTKQAPMLWVDLRDKAIFFPNLKEYNAYKNTYDCMRWVVVKQGVYGAKILRYGETYAHFTAEPVGTKNTCGAGDAFLAAFVASVLAKRDGEGLPEEALADACEYVRGRLLENTNIPRTI